MNPEHPTPSSKKRLLLIIGISTVLVVISFAITLFVLKAVTPHKETALNSNGSSTPSSTTASTDTVLADFQAGVPSLKNYQQLPEGAQNWIYYKQSDKGYQVSVQAAKAVVLSAQTRNSSPASLPNELASFFTSKGFTSQDSQDSSGSSLTYKTYTGSGSACQVAMTTPSEATVQTVTLGCVELAAITKEYTFVDQLISLYAKNNPKPTFSSESRNLVTSDNKSLSIVRLQNGPDQLALLFAAVDSQWEYIATLSEGDSASSNGKFVPSTSLTDALNNPKYGDFLKNNIQ